MAELRNLHCPERERLARNRKKNINFLAIPSKPFALVFTCLLDCLWSYTGAIKKHRRWDFYSFELDKINLLVSLHSDDIVDMLRFRSLLIVRPKILT